MQTKRLTDEQRQLATDNHNLIYRYMNLNNLDENEWYDILAIVYCKVVKNFNPELGFKISTLVWTAFDNEFKKEMRLRHGEKYTIPEYLTECRIENIIHNEDDFEDVLGMEDDKLEDVEFLDKFNQFMDTLNERDKFIVKKRAKGWTIRKISESLGYSHQNVHQILGRIHLKYKQYCKKAER